MNPATRGADAAEIQGQIPDWLADATGRLGLGFEDTRSQLIQAGLHLAERLESSAADLVREMVAKLESLRFRIAVVGQAKTGKSSFLNAMTGCLDLLPTAGASCTTAVTRVHFNHPDGQAPGAIFRFFSEHEWRRLMDDGGRLQTMSERLGTDLDLDLWRSRITELQARVHRRIGADYYQLLGKEHSFPWISPSLIAPYISAGDVERPDEVAARPQASYGDITRTADLYLNSDIFGCPLTFIDTPCINDPQGRDEITLNSIDDADACVVVLSARQALSKHDQDLLRIMHGLRKDRLVVFINRIDQLDDATRQAPQIVEQVRSLLLRELDANVIVLAGSAKWASAALSLGRGGEDALVAGSVASQAKAIGAAGKAIERSGVDESAEKLGQVLYACSGIPEVYQRLTDLLRHSALTEQMRETATTFATIARQSEGAARSELNVLEENVRAAHHSVLTDSWELHRLRGQLEKYDALLIKLDRISDNRQAALQRLKADALQRLCQELHDAVNDYVKRERMAIVFALDQLNRKDGVRFDVSGMRLLLEQAFVSRYRQIYGNIAVAEEKALQHFQQLLDENLPSAQIDGPPPISGSFVYPRLSALSRVGVFDIDAKLWRKWRKAHPTIQEAVLEFENVLATEFLDVANGLATVAEREVSTRVAVFLDRLSLTKMNAGQMVLKHKVELQTKLDHMQQALAPQAMERFLGEQLHRLSTSREHMLALVRLRKWVDELLDRTAPQRQMQEAV